MQAAVQPPAACHDKGFERVQGVCVPLSEPVVVTPPEATPTPEPEPTPCPRAVDAKGKPVKPKVDLTVSPRLSSYFPGTFMPVTVRLIITDADEQHWCPGVRWTWPDGTESFREGDCVPYEKAPCDELARKSWPKVVPRQYPAGEWTVTVRLERVGKPFMTKTVKFTVTGDDTEPRP